MKKLLSILTVLIIFCAVCATEAQSPKKIKTTEKICQVDTAGNIIIGGKAINPEKVKKLEDSVIVKTHIADSLKTVSVKQAQAIKEQKAIIADPASSKIQRYFAEIAIALMFVLGLLIKFSDTVAGLIPKGFMKQLSWIEVCLIGVSIILVLIDWFLVSFLGTAGMTICFQVIISCSLMWTKTHAKQASGTEKTMLPDIQKN